MPRTYLTTLPGLPHVEAVRIGDAMQTAGARLSRHPDLARIRRAGETRPGFVVRGPGGDEIGALVLIEHGRAGLAVVATDGTGPPALVADVGAAAGALAWHLAQEPIRARRREERAMRREEARRDRRPLDPFDHEALGRLTPADARPR